jgi:hypothetical protein
MLYSPRTTFPQQFNKDRPIVRQIATQRISSTLKMPIDIESQILIISDGSGEAIARSYFLVMGNSFPDHWGIYQDTLIKVNGEWMFKVREVTIEGADPGG